MSIEKVKFIHSASGVLNPSLQKLVTDALLTKEELAGIQVRLSGLSAQDELALVLFFLGSCTTIVPLDQGLTRAMGTNLVPADFLCNFKTIGAAFLEAKTTAEDNHKISKADRERRREFAAIFRIPLYYALRCRGIWGLFTDAEVEKRDGLIKPHDFSGSLFDRTAASYFVFFPPGLTTVRKYESNGGDASGIRHPQYGRLVAFRLSHGAAAINIEDMRDDDRMIMPAALTPLQVWPGREERVEQAHGITTITSAVPSPGLLVPLYTFMLSLLSLITSERGDIDATRHLRDLQDGHHEILPRSVVEGVLRELEAAGIGIIRPITMSSTPQRS